MTITVQEDEYTFYLFLKRIDDFEDLLPPPPRIENLPPQIENLPLRIENLPPQIEDISPRIEGLPLQIEDLSGVQNIRQ